MIVKIFGFRSPVYGVIPLFESWALTQRLCVFASQQQAKFIKFISRFGLELWKLSHLLAGDAAILPVGRKTASNQRPFRFQTQLPRPKSEQEWQVVSFNPNATATAIEQPPAAFGPGIAQEWCVRSPNRCTNYTIWGFGSMNIKIYLRMNITINATLLHALMRLVVQIAGNWSCGMASVRLMGQLRGVC